MAEVLGAIGFCFGSISFILSTIPTAAKALDDFSSCADFFRSYERRLVRCKARSDKWESTWRCLPDLGPHEAAIGRTKSEIQVLCHTIDSNIESNMTDPRELTTWPRIKSELRRGRFSKPRSGEKTVDFLHSVGFVLFKKNVIEGWIIRLETATDCIETLSQIEFDKRTAGQFETNPTRAEIFETRELEEFMQDLSSFAQRLYNEGPTIANVSDMKTYAWGLGLRPPAIDVEHWKYIAEVPIELRFSVEHAAEEDQHFHLDVPFHKDDKRTHLNEEDIKVLVSGAGTLDDTELCTPTARRTIQKKNARRTKPIGDLLKDAPNLFHDGAWRADRATLIQGISHWALLLWDTAWMEKLCCYGIQLEKGVTGPECVMQIFNVGECPAHSNCDHGARLRNLGLVLAQLILEKPIRRQSDAGPKTYQHWINGTWKTLYQSNIIQDVFMKTSSMPLSDAINFCLKDESAIANEPFRPGFLFKCIQHIHKPSVSEYDRTGTQADTHEV
jgi:hypothetical protein